MVKPKAQTRSRKKLTLIEEDATFQSLSSEFFGCGNESAKFDDHSHEVDWRGCPCNVNDSLKRLHFGSPHATDAFPPPLVTAAVFRAFHNYLVAPLASRLVRFQRPLVVCFVAQPRCTGSHAETSLPEDDLCDPRMFLPQESYRLVFCSVSASTCTPAWKTALLETT